MENQKNGKKTIIVNFIITLLAIIITSYVNNKFWIKQFNKTTFEDNRNKNYEYYTAYRYNLLSMLLCEFKNNSINEVLLFYAALVDKNEVNHFKNQKYLHDFPGYIELKEMIKKKDAVNIIFKEKEEVSEKFLEYYFIVDKYSSFLKLYLANEPIQNISTEIIFNISYDKNDYILCKDYYSRLSLFRTNIDKIMKEYQKKEKNYKDYLEKILKEINNKMFILK